MQLTTAPAPQYEDDLDLLRYGRFVASYWILLAVFCVAGLVAGLAVALRLPLRYQATATLNVTPPGAGSTLALTPATSRALLANLSLVAEALRELQLDRQGLTPQAFVDDALAVQPLPNTYLVRLTVTLPDPTYARMAADLLAKKAVALNRRLEAEGARAVQDALKVQMDEAGRKLDEAQARLLAFQTRAQVERRAAQALAQLSREGDGARVAMDLDLGTVKYEAPDGSGARWASSDRQRQTIGALAEDAAAKQFADLYRSVLELRRFQTDYEASKKVYSDIGARYVEASGRAVENVPQLLIVDAPVQPDAPMPRRRAQYVILGGLVGLVIGIIASLVLNRRRTLGAVAV